MEFLTGLNPQANPYFKVKDKMNNFVHSAAFYLKASVFVDFNYYFFLHIILLPYLFSAGNSPYAKPSSSGTSPYGKSGLNSFLFIFFSKFFILANLISDGNIFNLTIRNKTAIFQFSNYC